jgi:diguanylate cyclase (GGDEF)-like protein/PAS domain S-box-containing protein
VSASPGHQSIEYLASELVASVLGMLPDASVLVFDPELCFVLGCGDALIYSDVDLDALDGRQAGGVFATEQWARYEPIYRAALAGHTETIETWSPEETHCYTVCVGPLRARSGEILGGVAITQDITQRKHFEEARKHAQERFELVFAQSPIGMALMTAEGRLVRANEALLQMTGYGAQQLLSKTIEELSDPEDSQTDQEQTLRLRAGEIDSYQVAKRYRHAHGHAISVMQSVSLVRDRQGKPLHFVAQIQDLTEHRQIEHRLTHLTEHDQLTGLLSRKRLQRELALWVAESGRASEGSTLMVVGLSGLRAVNETHGYRVGDELLKKIAAQLLRRVRGGDLVARIDGNEFAILLPDTDPVGATVLANDLSRLVAECVVEANGGIAACTASFGTAGIGADSHGEQQVLMSAEQAMLKAKEEAREQYSRG